MNRPFASDRVIDVIESKNDFDVEINPFSRVYFLILINLHNWLFKFDTRLKQNEFVLSVDVSKRTEKLICQFYQKYIWERVFFLRFILH